MKHHPYYHLANEGDALLDDRNKQEGCASGCRKVKPKHPYLEKLHLWRMLKPIYDMKWSGIWYWMLKTFSGQYGPQKTPELLKSSESYVSSPALPLKSTAYQQLLTDLSIKMSHSFFLTSNNSSALTPLRDGLSRISQGDNHERKHVWENVFDIYFNLRSDSCPISLHEGGGLCDWAIWFLWPIMSLHFHQGLNTRVNYIHLVIRIQKEAGQLVSMEDIPHVLVSILLYGIADGNVDT